MRSKLRKEFLIAVVLAALVSASAQTTVELPRTYEQCFPGSPPVLRGQWGPGNGSSCIVTWNTRGQSGGNWGCMGNILTHTVYMSNCYCVYETSVAIALSTYTATCKSATTRYAAFSYYCQTG